MDFKERFVLSGVVFDAKTLLGQLAEQISDGLAFEVQTGNFGAPGRALFLPFNFRVAAKKIVVRGLELFHVFVAQEIMHGLIVAVADLDHELRQRAVLCAPVNVITEVPAEPLDVGRVFVKRFKQRENFFELLWRELAVVRKIPQPHFLRAVLK